MIHSFQCASGLNKAIIAKKESQLQTRSRALQEKDSILSTMATLLTRARECLTTQQVSIICHNHVACTVGHAISFLR